jgi:hypothetical protein
MSNSDQKGRESMDVYANETDFPPRRLDLNESAREAYDRYRDRMLSEQRVIIPSLDGLKSSIRSTRKLPG